VAGAEKQIGVKRAIDPLDGSHRIVDCSRTKRDRSSAAKLISMFGSREGGSQRSRERPREVTRNAGISLHLNW
jgi:hypothetical protein